MERIASFCVDHTKLDRGMYLSRQDGDVLTWDIRMKRPNHGDYLSTGAAHTLEHLFATYARNSAFQDSVIYVGPMGCRTGFYLLTRGLTPAEALELTVESFRFMAGFEGAVPGASEVECSACRHKPKEKIMERIASFCVDHTKLDRGMYLSRQDGDVLTWDIRMKRPNHGDYLSTGAAHTLEHLFATYARNSAFQDSVIYVGPMGCRTGFYLLTRGLTPAEALELTVESFRFMAGFEGAVPGASEVECGNYRDMDLPAAKAEAAAMLPVLEALTGDELHY